MVQEVIVSSCQLGLTRGKASLPFRLVKSNALQDFVIFPVVNPKGWEVLRGPFLFTGDNIEKIRGNEKRVFTVFIYVQNEDSV